MNFYRRYPQGYLLFFHITGKSVEISCYIKSPTGRDRTAAEGNHVASNRARRENVPEHMLCSMAGGETDVFYRWHQFRREAAGVPENSDLRALRRLWAVSGVHDLYVF